MEWTVSADCTDQQDGSSMARPRPPNYGHRNSHVNNYDHDGMMDIDMDSGPEHYYQSPVIKRTERPRHFSQQQSQTISERNYMSPSTSAPNMAMKQCFSGTERPRFYQQQLSTALEPNCLPFTGASNAPSSVVKRSHSGAEISRYYQSMSGPNCSSATSATTAAYSSIASTSSPPVSNSLPQPSPSSHSRIAKQQQQQRNVLKAKRKIANPSYICVLDTNVLLSHLNTLKTLIVANKKRESIASKVQQSSKSDSPATATNSSSHEQSDKQVLKIEIHQIVIPWIVFQELDGLKMSSNSDTAGKDAQIAIKFLNEQLKLSNGLVKGEPEGNRTNNGRKINELSPELNDDKILDCCIRLAQSVRPDQHKVVLISNDHNLQNKSLIHKIDSFGMDEFVAQYFDLPKPKFQFHANSKAAKVSNHVAVKEVAKKKVEEKEEVVVESSKAPKRHRPDPSTSNFSPVGIVNQMVASIRDELDKNRRKKALVANSTAINSPQHVKPHIEEIRVKYELEALLIEFIINTFTETYGEHWTNIFPKFKPNNASLNECLHVLKNNWLGVFSDYFGRDPKVLDLIKELLDRKNSTNLALLNQKSEQFLSVMNNRRSK